MILRPRKFSANTVRDFERGTTKDGKLRFKGQQSLSAQSFQFGVRGFQSYKSGS